MSRGNVNKLFDFYQSPIRNLFKTHYRYELMLKTWSWNSKERPNFSQIVLDLQNVTDLGEENIYFRICSYDG